SRHRSGRTERRGAVAQSRARPRHATAGEAEAERIAGAEPAVSGIPEAVWGIAEAGAGDSGSAKSAVGVTSVPGCGPDASNSADAGLKARSSTRLGYWFSWFGALLAGGTAGAPGRRVVPAPPPPPIPKPVP